MAHPFLQLGVSKELVRGLEDLQITTPTPVQEKSIPFLLEKGTDFIAQAQTGTGKTAAFGLPLITKVDAKRSVVQALVLAPTRDLAKQIGKHLFRYTKYTDKIFIEVLAGGDPIGRQTAALKRPTHIVVATPGRLLDLIKAKAVNLDAVRYLVLDEADEMLSMGFKKQLDRVFAHTTQRRATWLFSATFPPAIQQLTKICMSGQPQHVQVDRAHVVNRNIAHRYAVCPRADRTEFVSNFLRRRSDQRGLIFCRTKAGAIGLGRQLEEEGLQVAVIQGDLSQKERDRVMRIFQKERKQCLIATDVAARGIDVEDLAFVIHHQLPEQDEYYTHRSGRTARAGKRGISLALIEPRERKRLRELEHTLSVSFSEWY